MKRQDTDNGRVGTLVEAIRDDILYGVYRAGEWLKQIDLQERYEANRFEVRQALVELKNRRLVEHKVNSGFRVAAPDPEELLHLKAVRTILETGAAEPVVARATAADLVELDGIAGRFEQAIETADPPTRTELNYAFHRRLYDIAGNPVLAALIHDMRERGQSGTTGRWFTLAGLRLSAQEHHAMVAAIRARDAAALRQLIDHHINRR
ncbi:GntR family transcriptional regulator [Mycobacterium sp. KBS0706]|uniref:GntR family transcriptional regulator n=1 Tax=Mycobacterium sp. KBS0706 TaxID=2578109 RepID=UPI00110FD3F1|nr:GntR family transcriptional regulator [Mycobacterium sp. KBS0706]TSD88631.1 GntR family transcriptional regulator [Mycobacterium sp. KBS0706]